MQCQHTSVVLPAQNQFSKNAIFLASDFCADERLDATAAQDVYSQSAAKDKHF